MSRAPDQIPMPTRTDSRRITILVGLLLAAAIAANVIQILRAVS